MLWKMFTNIFIIFRRYTRVIVTILAVLHCSASDSSWQVTGEALQELPLGLVAIVVEPCQTIPWQEVQSGSFTGSGSWFAVFTLTAPLTNLAMMQVGIQFEICFNKTETSTVSINKNLSLGYDRRFCCSSLSLIDTPQTWCTMKYYHMTCVG